MRPYLASGFSWRHNFRRLAKNIADKGHHPTASWIYLENRPDRDSEEWDNFAKMIAGRNLIDLTCSNALVIDLRGVRKDGHGGVWSELGFALAKDWPIFVIGKGENTFLWAEGVTHVEDEQQLLALL